MERTVTADFIDFFLARTSSSSILIGNMVRIISCFSITVYLHIKPRLHKNFLHLDLDGWPARSCDFSVIEQIWTVIKDNIDITKITDRPLSDYHQFLPECLHPFSDLLYLFSGQFYLFLNLLRLQSGFLPSEMSL